MTWLWAALVTSSLITFASAPVVRSYMLHAGVMDVPNHRSSHTQPTPRGGGLACAAGAIAGNVVGWLLGQGAPWVVLAAASVLGFVGYVDDRRGLSPLPRLAAQVIVGAALGLALGNPWLALVGLALFPLMVNVVNFMDGINGISGATMAVWGFTMLALGLLHSSGPVSVIGALALGMAAGFLPWNVPTAKLFLGDVGSYFFGALIAAGVLVGVVEGLSLIDVAAPLIIYIADVGYTLWRRFRRGAPLTVAHREHAYQRLVSEARLPHWGVAAAVAVLSASISLAWHRMPTAFAGALTLIAVLAYYRSVQAVNALMRTPSKRTDSLS